MLGRVRNTLSSVAPDYSSGYGSNNFSDYGDVYSPTSSHACKLHSTPNAVLVVVPSLHRNDVVHSRHFSLFCVAINFRLVVYIAAES